MPVSDGACRSDFWCSLDGQSTSHRPHKDKIRSASLPTKVEKVSFKTRNLACGENFACGCRHPLEEGFEEWTAVGVRTTPLLSSMETVHRTSLGFLFIFWKKSASHSLVLRIIISNSSRDSLTHLKTYKVEKSKKSARMLVRVFHKNTLKK